MIKEFIIEQFATVYDENVWFVALKNSVEGLSVDEAAWSPEGSDKSIWKLLTHLNFYNNVWLIRFKGGEYKYAEGATNDDTFTEPSEPNAETLTGEVSRMNDIMLGWREALKNASEEKFTQAVSATNNATWDSILSDINTHTAYHAGQILLLRKLHGTWDAAKGVS